MKIFKVFILLCLVQYGCMGTSKSEKKNNDGPTETEVIIKNGSREIYGVLSKPDSGAVKQPIVLISHGFNGTHQYGKNYFPLLNKMGYQCYTFDFPCGSIHSRINNNTMNMSICDEQSDLEAVIAYFKTQPDIDTDCIILLGESQGGLVSALTGVSKGEDVAGLILVFPALCIPDNWRDRYPDATAIPDTTRMWEVALGKRFFQEIRDMDPYTTIGRFEKPVLLIHGDADPVVPVDYSRRAADTYKDATLHVIPGAGHGFKPGEFETSLDYISGYLNRFSATE